MRGPIGKKWSISRVHGRCDLDLKMEDRFTPAEAAELAVLLLEMVADVHEEYGTPVFRADLVRAVEKLHKAGRRPRPRIVR
jgi:hypothetical protein